MERIRSHLTKWQNCERCPLHEKRNEVVFFSGSTHPDILFVVPTIGFAEDTLTQPLVGLEHAYLIETLSAYPIKWAVTAAVACYAEKPTRKEIASCKHKLGEEIAILSPKKIMVLGVDIPHPKEIISSGKQAGVMKDKLFKIKIQRVLKEMRG